MSLGDNRRILIIDDNEAIHQDLAKLLAPQATVDRTLERSRGALFGGPSGPVRDPGYELTYAHQGREALDLARAAAQAGQPFALAIIDGRMPPGWDGLTTIQHLWREFPDLQIILCTAFADHSWEDITRRLGHSDSLLIVKKPFDPLEIRQAVCALSRKWQLTRDSTLRLEELRKAQRQVQSIIDYAPSLICLRGLDGRFLLVNGGFCHRFGVTRESIFGRTPAQCMPALLGEALMHKDTDTLAGGRTQEWEMDLPFPGGERTMLITKFPLYGLDGAPYAIAAVMTDLSRRKAQEEHDRHRVTMAALWRLSGTLAHDFNNLLTAIVGHHDLAIRKLEPDHPVRRQLDEIGKAAEAATGLAARLLRFSRRSTTTIHPCDLGIILNEQRTALEEILGPDVVLDLPDLPAPVEVMGDGEQLALVLQDLATVARETMPDGGRWSVTVTPAKGTAGAPGGQAPQAGHVEIVLKDTGRGLAPDALATLFDPVNSHVGGLIGMGLAGTKAVVHHLGGQITVASRPGMGTTFQVQLPLCDRPAEVVHPPVSAPSGGRPTVLVAEDEEAVRELIVQVLRDDGYDVLVGTDGQEALGAAWAHPGSIDLLVTDAIMPRLGGAALADRLLSRHPRLRVVFMSGYTESQAIRHQLPEGHAFFVQKPFTMADLSRTVRSALAVRMALGSWTTPSPGG